MNRTRSVECSPVLGPLYKGGLRFHPPIDKGVYHMILRYSKVA